MLFLSENTKKWYIMLVYVELITVGKCILLKNEQFSVFNSCICPLNQVVLVTSFTTLQLNCRCNCNTFTLKLINNMPHVSHNI